jgi:hypothetical protein
MAEYRVSDLARTAIGSGAMPATPQFEKERFGFSADLPVNERLRLLARLQPDHRDRHQLPRQQLSILRVVQPAQQGPELSAEG